MSRAQAWDFFQALRASEAGKTGQIEAEGERKEAVEALAIAERAYRRALAKKIVELRAEWPAV